MRKEVIFAVFTGGLLGLLVAFGVWRANSAFKPQVQDKQKEEVKSESEENQEDGLVIASPQNEEVVTSSPYSISGAANPGFIVISAEGKDYIAKTKSSGEFAIKAALAGGLNQLQVFSFANDSKSEKKLILVYSSEFAKYLDNKTEDPTEATTEADSIRQKVQEKLEKAQKVARAYIGSVTNISEDTIQIKTDSGEIKQAAVAKDAVFVKIQTSTKTVTFQDLAIGDFIIAMGLKNGNGVLDTKRVIITQPPAITQRKAITGIIKEINKKEVILEEAGQTQTLVFPKTWVGPNLNEIKKGDSLIAVGEASGSAITVRTIALTASIE